jgi:hypothetical protein
LEAEAGTWGGGEPILELKQSGVEGVVGLLLYLEVKGLVQLEHIASIKRGERG